MKDAGDLYREAERRDIPVLSFPLPENGSMCLQAEDGSCAIGLDEAALPTAPERKVRLAHELGHCVRGAFYNRRSPCDLRQRHENRADKWAIQSLIPRRELDAAIAAGCTTLWELAELFGVTEEFMQKAVCLHIHGNLNTQLYF